MPNNVITKYCITCRKKIELNVNPTDYKEWAEGKKFVQEAFPYLTADEREILISGICGKCFDTMFAVK